MAYLFDTDAISELLRPRPDPDYLAWLQGIAVDAQMTTAITVAELYWGAHRSPARDRHLRNIDERVLPLLKIIPFDTEAARRFGQIKAFLEGRGTPLADADLQIAAISLVHDHELVTGNVRHFERIPGLRLNTILAATRARGS